MTGYYHLFLFKFVNPFKRRSKNISLKIPMGKN